MKKLMLIAMLALAPMEAAVANGKGVNVDGWRV